MGRVRTIVGAITVLLVYVHPPPAHAKTLEQPFPDAQGVGMIYFWDGREEGEALLGQIFGTS